MGSKKDLEESVAPPGVLIPDIPDVSPIDTSEETGNGASARFFKGVGESNTDKWKNRRHMAWIALGAMLIGTILLWFVVPDNRLQNLNGLTDWFYIGTLSVVGAYIGFASMPFFNGKSR